MTEAAERDQRRGRNDLLHPRNRRRDRPRRV